VLPLAEPIQVCSIRDDSQVGDISKSTSITRSHVPVATDAAFVQDAYPDLQPRQLIVTLYGLYARDEHNWLSVAALVRLMGELGVDGQAVRSSVSRLKRRDTLRSLSVAGAAGYSLSPAALEVLREGDARIFHTRRAVLADGWVVVVFSVPES